MICPKCGGDLMTKDSRPHPGNTIRRRRECYVCGIRFTTFEIPKSELEKMGAVPVLSAKMRHALRRQKAAIDELLGDAA